VGPSILVVSDYHNVHSTRPEAEVFIGLIRRGFRVTVMTRPGSPYAARFEAQGVRVIEWLPRSKWARGEVRRIREELVAGRHDVLFLFENRSLYLGPRAAMGLPVKVVTYRGYDGNVHWYDPSCWLKVLHPRVDAYWCNAEAVRRSLRRNLLWGRDRAVTILKGHDVAWYDAAAADRASLGVPASAFAVATLANFRPMKGTRHLLEAMRHLPATAQDLHLVLVGPQLGPKLTRVAEESPARERIHLLGERRDPLPVIAACDAFALPSVKGEGFSKALAEAMSLGRPAVVTRIAGNEGIVVDGQSGRVVPPRDPAALAAALADLASDRARARAWGRAARERIATRFGHARTVEEMAAFLERLTGAAGADRPTG
jgi:glycosyltransferase involved in cell wall biosynthesis